MDRLWSPWRLEYVTTPKPEECIFCTRAIQADLVLFEGATCYVILNKYPYNNGHLMVVPYRHVATLGAVSKAELDEIGLLMQRSEAVLTEAYKPQGFNVGMNLGKPAGAGIDAHLHMHVVPRWSGDTNFMSVVGTMRVLPEDLGASAVRLRPIFERLSHSS